LLRFTTVGGDSRGAWMRGNVADAMMSASQALVQTSHTELCEICTSTYSMIAVPSSVVIGTHRKL
jgi:hypothetical protein